MRRSGERHPIVEALVFGAALLLFIILAYEGAKQFLPSLLHREGQIPAANPPAAAGGHELIGSGTQSAVTFVAPVKILPGGVKAKAPAVPEPDR